VKARHSISSRPPADLRLRRRARLAQSVTALVSRLALTDWPAIKWGTSMETVWPMLPVLVKLSAKLSSLAFAAVTQLELAWEIDVAVANWAK
jgi:hypothetical protein